MWVINCQNFPQCSCPNKECYSRRNLWLPNAPLREELITNTHQCPIIATHLKTPTLGIFWFIVRRLVICGVLFLNLLVFFGLNRKMWEIFYLGGRNWFGNTCPIFGIWFRYVWRERRNRRAFADIERTRDLRPKILFLCLLNLYHFVYKFLYFCDSLGYFKSFCMKYSLFNIVFLLMKKKLY